jgi:hypothetical protein
MHAPHQPLLTQHSCQHSWCVCEPPPGIVCSEMCKCLDCKNFDGSEARDSLLSPQVGCLPACLSVSNDQTSQPASRPACDELQLMVCGAPSLLADFWHGSRRRFFPKTLFVFSFFFIKKKRTKKELLRIKYLVFPPLTVPHCRATATGLQPACAAPLVPPRPQRGLRRLACTRQPSPPRQQLAQEL